MVGIRLPGVTIFALPPDLLMRTCGVVLWTLGILLVIPFLYEFWMYGRKIVDTSTYFSVSTYRATAPS